ncbi:MAG: helix-turn-helix transcriptional regulator [Opitutales bacterium]
MLTAQDEFACPFRAPVTLSGGVGRCPQSGGWRVTLHNGFGLSYFRLEEDAAPLTCDLPADAVGVLWLPRGRARMEGAGFFELDAPSWCWVAPAEQSLVLEAEAFGFLLALPESAWTLLNEAISGRHPLPEATAQPLGGALNDFAVHLIEADWFDLRKRLELESQCLRLIDLTLKTAWQEDPERGGPRSAGEDDRFEQIAAYLLGNLDAEHSLADIARRFHVNEFALKRGFKQVHGTTVFDFLRRARMVEAEKLLRTQDLTVLEVANRVGYTNASHFARNFKEAHGLLPKAYQCLFQRR